MIRLPALEIGTSFCWPFTLAHLARAAAAMRARPAADILWGWLVLVFFPYTPANAASAALHPANCRCTLSSSFFSSASMFMCSSPGEDCTRYSKLRGFLHQPTSASRLAHRNCRKEARVKRTDSFIEYSGETTEELLGYPAIGQHDSLVRAFEEGLQRKASRGLKKRYGQAIISWWRWL